MSYYDVLGVPRDAGAEAIRSAYRSLAKKHHPDASADPDAERKFKEIGEAYEVLKDDRKRAQYDRYGEAGLRGGGMGGMGGGFGADFGADFGASMADVFEELFGGLAGRGRRRRRPDGRGRDVSYAVELTLEEAFTGVSRRLSFDAGGGAQTVDVKIPAGIDEGSRLRISGRGEPGSGGGPSGDLYVSARFSPHPLFSRDGADLHCTAPIVSPHAALGGDLEVPSLDGDPLRVSVPEGATTGQRLRVRGRGMPLLGKRGRGDLYVTIKVETLTALTRAHKKTLRGFFAQCDDRNWPQSAAFREAALATRRRGGGDAKPRR